ncbi:hypothetical protein [Polymorphobacter megasporae]|uniref:hypothetical protein n=1 Tax=Glacieibacterium megasporae TaxID=2835787 RepID=UPI001C1E2348|nr:hypothetical protein [Polymorphobacter megasporae]UAJ09408.1 hypothetical protein KTC28_13975 [Polymorphobacter megasporae]
MIVVALAVAAALSGLDAAIKASVAPCPPPVAGEITVCGKRGEDEARRYMSPLPSDYEVGDTRAQSISAARNGLFDYDGGGTGSCSATGAGGSVGCGFQKHKHWALQRAGAKDSRGPLYDK